MNWWVSYKQTWKSIALQGMAKCQLRRVAWRYTLYYLGLSPDILNGIQWKWDKSRRFSPYLMAPVVSCIMLYMARNTTFRAQVWIGYLELELLTWGLSYRSNFHDSISDLEEFSDCSEVSDCSGVSINSYFEMPHPPAPSKPEGLPLFLEDDGSYSVNGPALHVNRSEPPTTHHLDSQVSNPTIQSSNISFDLHQHPIVTTDELAIPLWVPESHPPILIPALSPQSQHGVQEFPQGRYFCIEPGCTWLSPFETKQGLTRHRETKHFQKRRDCPIPGCKRVGNKGIKRKDNLRAHMQEQHQVKLPRQSAGARPKHRHRGPILG